MSGGRRRARGLLSIALAGTLTGAYLRPALAEVVDARTEARERFDRGLRLFNQQDNDGALAEFQRAFELVPHPMVLFNLGLVLAASGRSVRAVEAFDRLLANPEGLDAGRLARAREERAKQAQRIGEIVVTAGVEGATVELDGLEVGKTPLLAPLRTPAGIHAVGVVASGYAPSRKQVSVAGQTKVDLVFELVPSDTQPAHVSVKTRLLDCDVLVDGHAIGKTPLGASLALAPGNHEIEVRRAGYAAAKQTIALGPGSTGEVSLEPVPDAATLAVESGWLELAISEREATLFVDGNPRGGYAGPLQLPRGPHVLRVERAGFFPFERKVNVPQGTASRIAIELMPTPEQRASYRLKTTGQRTWGYVALGGGAALTLGGLAFVLVNKGQERDKEKAFQTQVARNQSGGDCDPTAQQAPDCEEALNVALTELDDVRSRAKFGWIGAGVGAAAAGLGAVLLLTNEDPDRYEPKPESDVFGKLWVSPLASIMGPGGGLVLTGEFR